MRLIDADKVVRQLEAEEQRYKAQALKTDDTTDMMRCCMGEAAMQTAIEIVKASGMASDIVKAISDDKISAIGSVIGAMAEARIQNELDKRYNDLEIQVEEDPIKKLIGMSFLLSDLSFECPEQPKQNITTLKKRIKYCKNPLERKKLEQELNTLYKEQKKIR